jgi:hypothetical protein
MLKPIIIFLITMAGFFLVAACQDENINTSTPPKKPDPKVETESDQENKVEQGPWQSPNCNSTDMAHLVPKFYWFTFGFISGPQGGSWEWTKSVETDGQKLLTWLGEDQDRLFIVGSFDRKRFLQQEWPWYRDQIKMLSDLHPNLPARNYENIAIDDQWDLIESTPDWFYKIHMELSKQM